MACLVGLSVSLVGGGLAAHVCLRMLRLTAEKDTKGKRVPPWVTGVVERLFFTCFAAFSFQAAPGAMITWIGLKMLTNWNRLSSPDAAENQKQRALAFSALLGGLVSMLFALIGGLICSRTLLFTVPAIH